MDSARKFVVPTLAILALVFATTTVYLLMIQKVPESDTQEERETIEFLTDKTTHEPGENITFILLNNGTDDIKYDSELRETLQIFSPGGWIIVMLPDKQTSGLTTIRPGENLTWTWNQTYYLYVLKEGELEPTLTWDYRSWEQVPNGKYTAEIRFGNIKKEVEFYIGN